MSMKTAIGQQLLEQRPYLADMSMQPIESAMGVSDVRRMLLTAWHTVTICSDYDVDGLTAGAQFYHYLRGLGVAVVEWLVPDRQKEGYGLSAKFVERVENTAPQLVVCLDFGTRDKEHLTYLNDLGIRTIVIDHHEVDGEWEVPETVFVNPKQPGCDFANRILCTSGLVHLILGGRAEYSGYAALGTLCDHVPLVGWNRYIAQQGLEWLGQRTNPPIQALKAHLGLKNKVTARDVGFEIGPLINAASRMGEVEAVKELFTTSTPSIMHRRVWRLAELNHARKQETKQGFEVALRMALVGGGSVCAAGAIHAGVTGIVAQKLVDRLNRVAVVLSQGEEGTLKGSARGLPGLDLVDAIRTIEQSGCLKHPVKYGGHEGAIGLTIHADDYPVFADQFDLYCCYETPHRPPPPPDATIRLSDISDELFDDLEKLGPFGAGNPDPVFGVQDLKVTDVRIMAREHTSVELWDGKDHSLAGVMWNIVEHPSLVMSKKVDATFTLGKNTYQGRTTIQATLRTVIDIGDREWRSRLGYVP